VDLRPRRALRQLIKGKTELPSLQAYVVALAVGLLVGILYGVLDVRSPAPPVVALVGLLGILLGEQAVPVAKRLLFPTPAKASSLAADCAHHLFGALPGRGLGGDPPASNAAATPERTL
jgi:XapX domain-containing protein